METAIAGLIGVAGTLLGSFATYLIQTRVADRSAALARDDRLRQEQLAACSAYAGALVQLKRGIDTLWFRRNDDPGDAAYKTARAECDHLGALAEDARFRMQLVFDEPGVMALADTAFASIGKLNAASESDALRVEEARFEDALREVIAAAASRLRRPALGSD